MENEVEHLRDLIGEQEKTIQYAKELVDLIVKNANRIGDMDIVIKAESLSNNRIILMAKYP